MLLIALSFAIFFSSPNSKRFIKTKLIKKNRESIISSIINKIKVAFYSWMIKSQEIKLSNDHNIEIQ